MPAANQPNALDLIVLLAQEMKVHEAQTSSLRDRFESLEQRTEQKLEAGLKLSTSQLSWAVNEYHSDVKRLLSRIGESGPNVDPLDKNEVDNSAEDHLGFPSIQLHAPEDGSSVEVEATDGSEAHLDASPSHPLEDFVLKHQVQPNKYWRVYAQKRGCKKQFSMGAYPKDQAKYLHNLLLSNFPLKAEPHFLATELGPRQKLRALAHLNNRLYSYGLPEVSYTVVNELSSELSVG